MTKQTPNPKSDSAQEKRRGEIYQLVSIITALADDYGDCITDLSKAESALDEAETAKDKAWDKIFHSKRRLQELLDADFSGDQ